MYPLQDLGGTAASSSRTVPSVTSATGTVTSTSSVVVSVAMASGIADPLACAPVTTERMKSTSKTTTTMSDAYHWRRTHTLYYGGLL
jgi:hypothetical protein